MNDSRATESVSDVSYCSSLEGEAWHGLEDPLSFESWHFDAVSDDGRDAAVITFYDHNVLSPRSRYFSADDSVAKCERFPAISFGYSVGGKTVLRAMNEFDGDAFRTVPDRLECHIAGSFFRLDRAEYGAGHFVSIDLTGARGRRIRAELEWLSIEADLAAPAAQTGRANWNLAVPRADVTGKIVVEDRSGRVTASYSVRGTGYHDHVVSHDLHYRNLNSRMWGRAHFFDTTVIFDRHAGVQDPNAPGRFFLVRNGQLEARHSSCQASDHRRDRWGLLVPQRIWFRSEDGLMIRVKPRTVVHSGFHQTKLLSEITLGLKDGRARKTIGLTEFVNPQRLRNGIYRWIVGLGVKKTTR